MKEFSLEEYLKNPDREVVTRYGEPVRIICTDRPVKQPIVALVAGSDVRTYFANGQFINGEQCGLDLMFASVKHEGWINLFKEDSRVVVSTRYPFKAEEDAKAATGGADYLATCKITWEEE